MPPVPPEQIRKDAPWEEASYMSPPHGTDKWHVMDGWIMRSHGKPRSRGLHPFHRSFPGKITSLGEVCVIIAFPVGKEEERHVYIDDWRQCNYPFPWQHHYKQWRGYTFFQYGREATSSQDDQVFRGTSSSPLPGPACNKYEKPSSPSSSPAPGPSVATPSPDPQSDGSFELI